MDVRPQQRHPLAPIDVHLYEGNDTCHTKCTCPTCCSSGQPPGPPSDLDVPAPFAPADDDDTAIDWQALSELYDIYAPLSVTIDDQPGSPSGSPASNTPGASSSTSMPSDQDILARVANILPPAPSHNLTISLSDHAGDSTPIAAPAPVIRSKPPAFRMGRRGQCFTQS